MRIRHYYYRVSVCYFLRLLAEDEFLFSAENFIDPLAVEYCDLGVVFLDLLD